MGWDGAGRGRAWGDEAEQNRVGNLVMKVQQALDELLVQSQGCTDMAVHCSQAQQAQQLLPVICKLCLGLYAFNNCLHLLPAVQLRSEAK